MPSRTAPARVLEAALGPIRKWSNGWYLFGAQAAILWGRPRLTADIDITVRLRSDDVSGFCQEMEKAGFRLRFSDPEFVSRTRVLPFLHTATQLPLDVVLSGPGLEDIFIDRARSMDIEGLSIPVASSEDVIIMKVLAGRPKDLDDVRAVMAECRATLDTDYIRSTLRVLEEALGQADLMPRFEAEWARFHVGN